MVFSALRISQRGAQRKRINPNSLRYVDNLANPGGDGLSWSTAWNSFSAIDWYALPAGTIIYVSGGSSNKTYNESLTIGASGSLGAPLTITRGVDAGHNGEPIINGQATRFYGVICENRAYVTVSYIASINNMWGNFRFRFNTRDVVLDGCRAFMNDIPSVDGGGIAQGTPRGFDLRSNVTDGGSGTYAIILRNSSVDSVTDTLAQTDCVYMQDNDGVLIENNNLVCSNGNTYGHSDGIQSYQDGDIIIRNNIVSHPNGGNDNHGVWLQNTLTGKTITVYNNLITRGTANASYGLSHNRIAAAGAGYDGKALIYNNTIYNGWWPLELNNSPLSEVKNNILHYPATRVGIRLLGSLPPAANVNNNLIWGSSGSPAEVSGSNKTWAQYQAFGFDAQGVNADPLFTNPSIADFTLQAGSPARNAGQTLAAVTTDRSGVPRPQGAAYDIGAHEAL